jgi:hypothetical protein
MCRWCVTYCWEYFNKGYNFVSHLTLIRGLHKKLWASKLVGVPISWESPKNDIWVQPLWLIIENIIKGSWWFPPSSSRGESYESVYAYGSYVHEKCFNYALTNLWFDLCKSIWIIDPLVIHCSPHFRALARPSYLWNVMS